jgi:3-hydroxyisobutyrate dehydrogenase-like beta-hydroxyacid dehydrogenase
MGLAMAKNLQSHLKTTGSPAICYTNRTMSRGVTLEALGGRPYESIAEVAQKSDIIFSSVCNGDLELTHNRYEILHIAKADL